MKNLYIKKAIIALILPCISSMVSLAAEYKPLDWKDRPTEVQKIGYETYRAAVEGLIPNWIFQYSTSPHFLEFNYHTLIKKIILSSAKKNFFIIELGIGGFAWGREVKNFINSERSIPPDIMVNIISLRREKLPITITKEGKCNLQEYGNFNIENLIESLNSHSLSLNNQVDFIMSKGCFIHLADPLGTLVQLYNLLTPKTGLLSFNSFFVSINNSDLHTTIKFAPNILRFILLTLNAPFLIYKPCNFEYNKGIERIIIQRPNNLPCKLPFKYNNNFIIGKHMIHHIKNAPSNIVNTLPNIRFNLNIAQDFIMGVDLLNNHYPDYLDVTSQILGAPNNSLELPFMLIQGDKKLYDWMEEAHNDSEISKYRAYANLYIKVAAQP